MKNMSIPAVFLLLFLASAPWVSTTLPPPAASEVGALLDIKSGISSDPFGYLVGWSSNGTSDPCSWRGVECRPRGRHHHARAVYSLNLMAAGLSGVLPPSIGNLSSLVRLDLGFNSLSGHIPGELTRCKLLEYIDLSNNHFSASIPADLVRSLPSLRYLSIYSNNLSGVLPPGIPWSLETVYLNNNNLSGELGAVGQDCRLSTVYLHGNALSGHLPPGLSRCSNLSELVLNDNYLDGVVPFELGLLDKLSALMIARNNLQGQIPTSLGRCSSLSTLDLSDNFLTGSIPAELGNCSSLELISLNDNKLSGRIPATLCSGSSIIRGIDFSNNMLNGTIPAELGECSSLQYLSLEHNSLTGGIPKELGKLKDLWQLWLLQNNLTGPIPPELGNLSSLKELLLSTNRLSGTVPAELGKLAHLQKLYLDMNQLEGELPPEFGKHTNFSELEFSDNRLTGRIPSSLCSSGQLSAVIMIGNLFYGDIDGIANCSSITRLRLSGNALNGTIPKELGSNKELSFLDLASNFFHGDIPRELGRCSNLSSIDLSRNRLSGPVPVELGRLSKLEKLSAASNRLNGSMPVTLGECRSLTVLDLSDNELEGRLPESLLSGLSQLQNLRLSGNRLSGEIPAKFFVQPSENLMELQLGDNELQGPIPNSIGRLRYLSISLNLSWNQLSGPLPAELGGLDRLQSLDLSHNRLNGRLPEQLSGMVSLVVANLSFNQLVGELPGGGPWLQFRSSSFTGNSGLCMFSNACHGAAASSGSTAEQRRRQAIVLGVVISMSAILFVMILLAWINYCTSGGLKQQLSPRRTKRVDSIKLFGDSRGVLSLRDVSMAVSSLSDENVIGRGAHGIVYKVTTSSGQVFAAKKLLAKSDKEHEDAFQSFEREIETAGKFRHRNLVKILAYRSSSQFSLIIYEYMSGGSLSNALHRHGDELGWDARCKIALGAAQGLAYLHHDCVPMVIHRDVKSSNILLDEDLEGKLSDFGIAKLIPEDDIRTMSMIVGTYGYIAPEYCYTMRVTEKIDVYAFGVVLLELVTRRSPFHPAFVEGMDMVSWVRGELQRTGSIEDFADPVLLGDSSQVLEMVKVGLLCTLTESKERPTMRQVVQMLEPLVVKPSSKNKQNGLESFSS